jgi:ATP-dependent exoDNAse (exonuclease V) alpha subunit
VAIYHLSVKVIGRSSGRSAVAAAAYRAADKLYDVRSEKLHDYSNKPNVEYSEILTPDGAGQDLRERESLWNAVEAGEKRKDSQLAREVEVSLPRELTGAARITLLRDFVNREFVSQGMIADMSIHNPPAGDGGEQPHAHILLTMRSLNEDGESFGGKNRQWNRDFTDGKTSTDDRVGGFANTQGKGNGYVGEDTSGLFGLRERWAVSVNHALEDSGSSERVDHRSYAAQGVELEPQPKIGVSGMLQQRTGIAYDQPRILREVQDRNEIRFYVNPAATHRRAEIVGAGSSAWAADVDMMQAFYSTEYHPYLKEISAGVGHDR